MYTSLFNININWHLDWKIGFLKRVPISKSSQWDKGILSRLQINQAKKWMPWFCRETVIRYFLLIPVYCIVMITWLELCKYYLLGSRFLSRGKGDTAELKVRSLGLLVSFSLVKCLLWKLYKSHRFPVGFCSLCFYFPTKLLHFNAPFFH